MHLLKPVQFICRQTSYYKLSAVALVLLLAATIVYLSNTQLLHANSTLPINAAATTDSTQKVTSPTPYSHTTDQSAALPSIWPANGPISSAFGARSAPLEGASQIHEGIDIAIGYGLPVVATADGQVVHSGWSGGYGNLIQINHGNGLETRYGHNSQLVVSAGQTVQKGQIIAYAGSTGNSTGPHVHYEVRENGTAVNPLNYLLRYDTR